MRRTAVLALVLAGGLTAPAHAERLTVRSPAVSAALGVHAAFTSGGTAVRVRGRARGRVTLVLIRCADRRCVRFGRRQRAARRLRRRVRVTLRVGPARFAQLELRRGRRVLGRVRLRRPPASPVAVVPVPPPASTAVFTDPPLMPAYDRAVPDYTIACEPGRSVRVTVGDQVRTLALQAGQAFSIGAHSVRCLPRDWSGWTVERDGAPASSWIVFTTVAAANGYTVIADGNGVPVWWKAGAGALADGRVLPDGTVAVSRLAPTAFETDPYSRFALDGTLLGTIDTVGTAIDHHDLEALPNGNLLLMAYVRREHADLTAIGGPADAPVIDGLLQEVTPSRQVVWSWRSSDHIATGETTFPPNQIRVPDGDRSIYDLVHLNSLQSDGDAVIISARHLDAVLRVRRSDGGIDWKLGGTARPESLAFDGDFGGQHMARRLPDGTLTVHDNGTGKGRPPRALRLAIDPVARTARVIERVSDPRVASAFCCGSATRLSGGHWLMSWGGSPVITELAGDGRPVLTLRLDHGFSYRAYPVSPSLLSRAALRAGMDAMAPR
jgi:Arylsulfotransferase (ASST)